MKDKYLCNLSKLSDDSYKHSLQNTLLKHIVVQGKFLNFNITMIIHIRICVMSLFRNYSHRGEAIRHVTNMD